MINLKGKTVGILGAIILHLIAGIIFMVVQIGSIKEKGAAEIIVEFEKNEEVPVVEKKIEVPLTSKEVFENIDEISNIAKNTASKSEEIINKEEYINKVKEELIQSGKLGVDNYIDEQKKVAYLSDKGETTVANTEKEAKSETHNELEKIASTFKGPTRIYYNLPGRYHTYLPIPIYKCEGSGNITLSIEVNPVGVVVKAEIIAASSSTVDECLIETAVNSAMISRFNPDVNASKVQSGTLTYQFVAQ